MKWDKVAQIGNPTKSAAVNHCIKQVQRSQARSEGKATDARRDLEFAEFLQLLALNMSRGESVPQCHELLRHLFAAAVVLQWHIIGRVDDMEHLNFSSLTPHLEHDFLINIKIDWSKNVMTETQSSPQVVLGSMDERLCPLAHLGMYFSVLLHNAGSIPLLPDALFQMRRSAGVPFCRVKKEVLSSRLRELFGCCIFCKLREGLLGSHSVRKGACTYCRSRNVSLDNTNQRGRWRGRGSQASMQIGTYTNTSRLSFPDAIAASALCGAGGPCRYEVAFAELRGDQFLRGIVPGLYDLVGPGVARVLSVALMWVATTDSLHESVVPPPSIKARIREYVTSKLLPDHSMGVCVVRVPLLAVGTEQGGVEFVSSTTVFSAPGGLDGTTQPAPANDHLSVTPNVMMTSSGEIWRRSSAAPAWWERRGWRGGKRSGGIRITPCSSSTLLPHARGHSAFDAIDLILQKYGHHSSVTKIIRAIAADKGARVLGIAG